MTISITEIINKIEAMGWQIILPPITDGKDSISGFVCGKPEYIKTVIDESRMSGGFGPVETNSV